jgi:hypothetical protein
MFSIATYFALTNTNLVTITQLNKQKLSNGMKQNPPPRLQNAIFELIKELGFIQFTRLSFYLVIQYLKYKLNNHKPTFEQKEMFGI